MSLQVVVELAQLEQFRFGEQTGLGPRCVQDRGCVSLKPQKTCTNNGCKMRSDLCEYNLLIVPLRERSDRWTRLVGWRR